MRRTTIKILIASVALTTACGDSGQIRSVGPKMVLSTQALDLGEVPVGATQRAAFEIRNEGTGNLEIANIQVDAPFFVGGFEKIVPPGAAITLDVAVRPEEVGATDAVVRIDSNNIESPTLQLDAHGLDGLVAATPERVELSDVTIGTSRTVSISTVNYSDVDLPGRIVVDGFERSAHFAGLADGAPFTIGPRQDHSIELTYQPSVIGEDTGRILFEYCGDRCGIEVEVHASAVVSSLRVEPSAIDFGQVEIGERKMAFANIVNQGTRAIEVTQVEVMGSDDVRVVLDGQTPFTLEAGAEVAVGLEFTAGTLSPITAQLVVDASAEEGEPARAQLGGRGSGSVLHVAPEAINFGVQLRDTEHRRAILLSNVGTAPLTINDVRFSGDSVFGLADMPALPLQLFVGESLSMSVTFDPDGEGASQGTLSVTTDLPEHPAIDIPVQAAFAQRACRLDLAPRSMRFGTMPTNHARQQSLRITNAGDDACTIISSRFGAVSGAPFSLSAGETWPVTLARGESHDVTVRFSGATVRQFKTDLVLTTDDDVFPDHHVQLVASTLPDSDVYAQPSRILFPLGMCSQSAQTTTLYNSGSTAVIIDQITIRDNSFRVVTQPVPITVGPGGNTAIVVQPLSSQVAMDEIEVTVRGRPMPIVVPVQSISPGQTAITDTYRQRTPMPNRQVDVVFVVSNNCIMQQRQRQVADAIATMMQAARASGADVQIGVTTSAVEGRDAAIDGRLRGPVIQGSDPDLATKFRAQIDMGGTGRHFDKGMAVTVRTLERASVGESPNRELFRPGSHRVFILISNEDDYSPDTPTSYRNSLLAFGADGSTYQAILLIPGTNGLCPYRMGTPRYQEFGQVMGGMIESVCERDYTPILSRVGQEVFGIASRFVLSSRPDEQSIRVVIEGQPVTAGWTYDNVENAIVFSPGAEPGPGETIEITFLPGC